MRRHLFLIGSQKRDVVRLARFCAWGNHWMSAEDKNLHDAGALTTHGCCAEHQAALETPRHWTPGPSVA